MAVTIYGSCVSRDVLRVKPVDEVDAYAARSSWVSAFTAPAPLPDRPIGLESAFQARMVEDDFQSRAAQRIAETTGTLLLDLTDERFGVTEYAGGYITPSNEFQRSAWSAEPMGPRHPFASPRHVELFASTVPKMAELLAGRRAWIVRARYADWTDTGAAVRPAGGWDAERWAQAFAPYFAEIERAGLPILDVPAELSISSADHIWGPAPMHYTDEFYGWIADRLADAPTVGTPSGPEGA